MFQQKEITDRLFLDDLKGDMALNRYKWKEAGQAIPMLEQQIKDDPANLRARYDHILSLREKERMEEVIKQFELVSRMTKTLPFWVTESVADAYLYLEKPKEALTYYKITLKKEPPDMFNTLMGIFYIYQELRDWEHAEEAWDKVEELLATRKRLKKWRRLEAVEARGWYLTYQDKLQEAQEYFYEYLKQAGMNSAFRTGLAHVYLWRGWPRKALEQFRIANNYNPKDVAAQNGVVLALNKLNYKREARILAEKLRKKYPTKKHVLDTYETLQVEEMHESLTETKFINEDPGSEEYWVKSTLKEPIIPIFKLFQEVIWQETTDDTSEGKEDFEWKRAGLGYEWIVVPQLIWKQAFTFDFEKMEEYGYYSILTWLPTDPLKITAGYDSFRLDIPLRARSKGVEGESAFWDVFYHESELRHYGISSGYNWYDDGNLNSFYKLYYDQSVLNMPDLKLRLGGELYYSRNRKTHVDYFSPAHDLSFVLTPSLHWIHFFRYDKKVRSSIYSRIGFYKQHKYDYSTIGGVTYEQLIRLSKTFEFRWNVSWDRKVYDGDSTDVWGGYCALRKNF
jgi:biofilm PGA synthesis protein PgaA